MNLLLPAALRAQIAHWADTAFPAECCGLIEGLRAGDEFRAIALHPARNLAAAPDRFAVDPADHFAATKSARRFGHAIIGCYHSHPNGKAEPSAADLSGAAQQDFLWLIAAAGGGRCDLAGFVYGTSGFEKVGLVLGADLVTSSLNERS